MSSLPFRTSVPSARRLQIFVHDLSATGVVRNAIAIANRAAHEGFRTRLLVCHAGGTLADQVTPAVEIKILLDGEGVRSRRHEQLRRALLGYRRETRAWRPDVMVSAGAHGHLLSTLAWIGLPGAKVLRISNDLAKQCGSPRGWTRLSRSIKLRFLLSRATRVVLVSRQQAKHPAIARLSPGKVVRIPNGVDILRVRNAALAPVEHPWLHPDADPLVLAVGRLSNDKNIGRLVEAIHIAQRSRTLRLIVLGESDGEARRVLGDKAAQLGIGHLLDCVGPVANPFPWMRAASVVALPSLWEGSSNVLLEALALGTPVVASRTAGDSWHVLENGCHGILVNPLDPADIAAGLLRQIGDDVVRPADRALTFSNSLTLDRYIQLFSALARTDVASTFTKGFAKARWPSWA